MANRPYDGHTNEMDSSNSSEGLEGAHLAENSVLACIVTPKRYTELIKPVFGQQT